MRLLRFLFKLYNILFSQKSKVENIENKKEIIPDVIIQKPEPKKYNKYLWILDNGHGKLTSGKRSPIMDEGRRFFEYEFNRDIVERIIGKIDELGFHYYDLVDDFEKRGNFLKGRVDRANNILGNRTKIYLSIHSNAAPAPSGKWCDDSTSGIETWHKYGDLDASMISDVFQKHLVKKMGWKDRGLKSHKTKSKEFYVLKRTEMVAVLTESGFYNNKIQVKQLMRDDVRDMIAEAHVAAMIEIEEKGIL